MDSRKSITHPLYHVSQIIRTSVGKFLSLDVRPSALDRIQIRGICRKAYYCQPFVLLLQKVAHPSAAVRRQAVPDQDNFLTTELSSQL